MSSGKVLLTDFSRLIHCQQKSNKKSNSKTPSKTEIPVEEIPKKQTPKNKSTVAEVLKKETPKVKAAPVEGFFLLDNLKTQGGDNIQVKSYIYERRELIFGIQTETEDPLFTILTQALQSNDVSLLDSCFESQVKRI